MLIVWAGVSTIIAGLLAFLILAKRVELSDVRTKYEKLRETMQFFAESKPASEYMLCIKVTRKEGGCTYYDVSDIDLLVGYHGLYFKQKGFGIRVTSSYDIDFRTFLCKRSERKEIGRDG